MGVGAVVGVGVVVGVGAVVGEVVGEVVGAVVGAVVGVVGVEGAGVVNVVGVFGVEVSSCEQCPPLHRVIVLHSVSDANFIAMHLLTHERVVVHRGDPFGSLSSSWQV